MDFKPNSEEDIEHRFRHHPPANATIAANHTTLRACMENTAKAVVRMTPPGREQSLAITKLEEALMWGNAAIARNPEFFGPSEFPEGPAPQGII